MLSRLKQVLNNALRPADKSGASGPDPSALPAIELAHPNMVLDPLKGAKVRVYVHSEISLDLAEELKFRDVQNVLELDYGIAANDWSTADMAVFVYDDWSAGSAYWGNAGDAKIAADIAKLIGQQGVVFVQRLKQPDRHTVWLCHFVRVANGKRLHPRCMARSLIDHVYSGGHSYFNVYTCSGGILA